MTVTFSLFALKGIAPEFVTVVIANTSAITGSICRYAGVRFFWGAESLPHVRFHQVVVVVCALLLTYYTCIDDNIVLRLFAVSLIVSGYFRHRPQYDKRRRKDIPEKPGPWRC